MIRLRRHLPCSLTLVFADLSDDHRQEVTEEGRYGRRQNTRNEGELAMLVDDLYHICETYRPVAPLSAPLPRVEEWDEESEDRQVGKNGDDQELTLQHSPMKGKEAPTGRVLKKQTMPMSMKPNVVRDPISAGSLEMFSHTMSCGMGARCNCAPDNSLIRPRCVRAILCACAMVLKVTNPAHQP